MKFCHDQELVSGTVKNIFLGILLVLCTAASPIAAFAQAKTTSSQVRSSHKNAKKHERQTIHVSRKQKKALKRAEQKHPGCAEPVDPEGACV